MPYETGRDLKEDVLFRAGESTTASQWNARVIDYLNRCYRSLAMGASEFLPEYVNDWWWLRDSAVLNLDPVLTTGTVAVTQDSTSITFSSAPAASKVDWRFKVDGHPDLFIIASHTGGAAAATLDAAYTGETAAAATYKAMHVEYSLDVAVASLLSPMKGFRGDYRIEGMTPERMDHLYPLALMQPGVAKAFSLEDEQTVRFSHGGRTDGISMRVEYGFRPLITDLTDSALSEPLLPSPYRHILADMALTMLLADKNDDRAQGIGSLAKSALIAMVRENRRRLAKMDSTLGKIMPRQGAVGRRRGPLRTESGLIIG